MRKKKNGDYSKVIYLGYDSSGKQINKRISAPTKSKLAMLERQYRLEFKPNLYVPVTLLEAYNLYIKNNEAILSPSTVRGFNSIFHATFKDWHNSLVGTITQDHIQEYINSNASKLSFKTISNRISLLTRVMSQFVSEAKNWQFKMPPKTKASIYLPTTEEIETILEYAHIHYPEFELPIMFGAYCGLRRGEIGALTYDDIDYDNALVTITKSVVLTPDSEFKTKTPKTYAGFRSVPLSDSIMTCIKRRQENGLKLISVTIEQITDRFPLIVQRANVHKMRFHDLIHFFVSYLVTLNIPDLYAIKLTGHSTTSMLQRVYQHTFSDTEKSYQDKIRQAFPIE